MHFVKRFARIQQAVANEERIIVYGDFDADGVTSTVLLVEALRGLGMSREQVHRPDSRNRPRSVDRVGAGG